MFEEITIRNQDDLSRLIAQINGKDCPVEMSVTIEVSEDIDLTPFFKALEENSSIRKLTLNYPDDIRNTITQKVAEVLGKNRTLQELNLSFNGINVEGDLARALAFELQKNSSLQRLGLDRSEILQWGLDRSETLRTLSLVHDGIGIKGARAIADALKKNGTLQRLDLSNNSIGDEGARAIAFALRENRALQTLNLSSNSISHKSTQDIARALEKNGTLQWLSLGGNRIGDKGARDIADALENGTLHTLFLDDNGIGYEGARAIAFALEKNGPLQWLSLGGNRIGDKGAQAIAEVLQENPRPICILPWALKGREAIRIFRECAQFKEGVEKAENDVHHPVRIFANGVLFGGEPSVLPQHNLNIVTSARLVSDFLGHGVKLSDTTPPKRSPKP